MKDSLTTVSLVSSCDQLGLPAQITALGGGKKESEMDRKSKGLKVEKATNSGFSNLSQRQLHPHGISLKYTRKGRSSKEKY